MNLKNGVMFLLAGVGLFAIEPGSATYINEGLGLFSIMTSSFSFLKAWTGDSYEIQQSQGMNFLKDLNNWVKKKHGKTKSCRTILSPKK